MNLARPGAAVCTHTRTVLQRGWQVLLTLLRSARHQPWSAWPSGSPPWQRRGQLPPGVPTERSQRTLGRACLTAFSQTQAAPDPVHAVLRVQHAALLDTRGARALARCAELGVVAVRISERGSRTAEHTVVATPDVRRHPP